MREVAEDWEDCQAGDDRREEVQGWDRGRGDVHLDHVDDGDDHDDDDGNDVAW